jgi:hypothetical protein
MQSFGIPSITNFCRSHGLFVSGGLLCTVSSKACTLVLVTQFM